MGGGVGKLEAARHTRKVPAAMGEWTAGSCSGGFLQLRHPRILVQGKPAGPLTAWWQSGRGHLRLREVGPLLMALVTYPAQHSLQPPAAH